MGSHRESVAEGCGDPQLPVGQAEPDPRHINAKVAEPSLFPLRDLCELRVKSGHLVKSYKRALPQEVPYVSLAAHVFRSS